MSGRAELRVGSPRHYLAPAKLNLFLHVIGRRDDGYHLLQSAMQLIDLADELTIDVRDDERIVRSGTVAGVPEDDDIAVRAARMLQREAATSAGVTIGIVKRIPIGGGLGGGSSDAATTLLALNRLWGLNWPKERLGALGARLGADVPFFIGGTSAFVEGVGDRITPIDLPAAFYAVIHPGVQVPTATVFTAPELTRDARAIKISDFSKSAHDAVPRPHHGVGADTAGGTDRRSDRSGDRRIDGATAEETVFGNDLEPVATARYPAVREALDRLADPDVGATIAGALGPPRMSGSGACVFRAFDTRDHAGAAVAGLPSTWTGWSVRSLAAHPHADCVDA